MSRPEYVASIHAKCDRKEWAETMRRNLRNPEFVAKLRAYLHSERNPFRDPATREKGEAALRAKGYSMLNGGNGTGRTRPQKMLAELLGWEIEYVVRTGMPRGSGYPTHYKLDIAHPQAMLAVEVDGQSHHSKSRMAQDVKKDEFLEHLGWIVVRVRNEDVLQSCEAIARSILSLMSKHPLATTSRMEFWSTTATA